MLIALFLILLVLMQRPKSEGIGASLGGAMMNELFSAQTTNVLQKATRWLGGSFFLFALVISMMVAHASRSDDRSAAQKQIASAPLPKAEKDVDMNINTPVTQAELMKMLQQKVARLSGSNSTSGTDAAKTNSGTAATTGTAAPSTTGTTSSGSSSSGIDLQAPAMQLNTGQTGAPGADTGSGLQLQTGTAPRDGSTLLQGGGQLSGHLSGSAVEPSGGSATQPPKKGNGN